MDDYVSRNAIIQMFNTADRYVADSLRLCDTDKQFPQNEVFIVDDMYEGLEQLPSAQPERKTGRWINITNEESLDEEYKCSLCGWELFLWSKLTNYCPNCGCKMEVTDE